MSEAQDHLPGGRAIAAPDIDAELRALWREAGTDQASGVTRALLLNFVTHVPPDGDVAAASRTVARVAAAIPCRAFVLVESPPGPGATPPLEAWIASHCVQSGPGKQVCCEQVSLRARADARDALVAQLLSLRVPDLPVVLWWPDGDIGSPLLERVAQESNRLVVDSSTFSDAAAGIARVARLSSAPGAVAVADDVTWTRLDAWRELTASLFDFPPCVDHLPSIHAARITHSESGAAAAWLYAGWLASRLNWRPRARRGQQFEFDASNGRTTLQLEAGAAPHDGGATLLRIALHAATGAVFDIAIDPVHPTLLAAHIEGIGDCPRPQHRDRHPRDRDDELVRVLQRRRPNRAYTAALFAAAVLCEMPA